MKRYLVTSAMLATSMFAATDVQILDYIKAQASSPDVKIAITKREKLQNYKEFEVVTVNIGKGNQSQDWNIFTTKGDLIFPEVINIKEKKSYLKEIQEKQRGAKLKKVYSSEDKNNIITLGHDKKKETLVIFTDPECPYCRQELKKINERLKTNNIKLIMTPVHGRSALEKSHLIYKEIKKAKDDKAKITILNKYFAKDVNISGKKVTDNDVKAMEILRQKYFNGLIKGVPASIPEKDIK